MVEISLISDFLSATRAWFGPVLVIIVLYFLLKINIGLVIFVLAVWLFVLPRNIDEGELEYMAACTASNTKSSCLCASNSTCDCIEEAFKNDKEWAGYKEAYCLGLTANKNRLLNSYSQCRYGDCNAECTEKLTQIVNQIETFNDCEGENFELSKTPLPFPNTVFYVFAGLGTAFCIYQLLKRKLPGRQLLKR